MVSLRRIRVDNNVKCGDILIKWHGSECGPEIRANFATSPYRIFPGKQEIIYLLDHFKRKLTNIHTSCRKTLLSHINLGLQSIYTYSLKARFLSRKLSCHKDIWISQISLFNKSTGIHRAQLYIVCAQHGCQTLKCDRKWQNRFLSPLFYYLQSWALSNR